MYCKPSSISIERVNRASLLVATLAAASVFGGCLDGATTADATVTGADTTQTDTNQPDTTVIPPDTASEDATISDKSCESNLDCAGGEVCRGQVCRVACASSEDCAASAPACDGAAGYCVACITAEDCGANGACTDRACTFYCREDAACSTDSYCDLATGACAQRECEVAADCSGGYRCERFQYQPIDPTICDADVARCDAAVNAIISCNIDGTRETVVPCADDTLCVLREGAPTCAERVCEPNALGCEDPQNAFECDATGTMKTVIACPTGRLCADGICQQRVCVPGTSRCDGAGIRVCAEDGLSEPYSTCAMDDACIDSPHGCACAAGACTPLACTPGSMRCAGVGTQTCAANGRSWSTSVACGADETCVPPLGACLPAVCTPGVKACFGEVLATCDTTGTSRTTTDCAAADRICMGNGANTACRQPLCEPDSISCLSSQHAIVTCDSRGASAVTTPCPDGEVCQAGACIDGTGACPTAAITVTEGDEVIPGTILHLSAASSIAAVGTVARWEWSVTQQSTATTRFLPSNTAQNVTFEVGLVGEYIFQLKVWDSNGQVSCDVATFHVQVTSDSAIHVELSWDTPADADQTDTGFNLFGESVGSDLDLHFLHPNANTQYFHSTYDCNWLNINPNWGSSGPLDNPKLIRDDTDGAGPEILLFEVPEFGATYRVGAHYWDDWAYGPSTATIRVFVYGELREEWRDVELVNKDLWDALTIAWPSQTITRLTTTTGGPAITPNFNSGFFP